MVLTIWGLSPSLVSRVDPHDLASNNSDQGNCIPAATLVRTIHGSIL